MKLIDLNDDRVYTPADLKRDWAQFRDEDPDNHAASFRIEFFEILMATINGRNDLEITGRLPGKPATSSFACGHSFEIKEGIRMYIHELLNNPEFNFNAPVRILKYLGGDETVTVFDSTVSGDIHFDLMMKSITAINPGDDGVLEIEYAD